ncbi:hypothetical protein BGW38_002233 [Lunasporangiospora selenospora]|uniref:Uncharacterized protein n=1 Tax=Lunasporangiospora selenospora TaxID=979761 RepID=A0A9P6G3B4_9FUNG|nr:hypothetical protein BGW38_002233 [Lunasporangiospora selenospora]
MIFLRRTASKYNLFPVINISQFINQWCVFFLITSAFGTISHRSALWLNVINNVAYFITKPTTMYLAYLRCSAVFSPFQKFRWLHYSLVAFRAAELFVIIVVNIIQNELCDGSIAKGTRCEGLAIAWTFRDAGAPVFRLYYIICEAIFYYKLFTTLKCMSQGKKNVELMQYRRLQTSLFTIDLLILIFMSIYRIIGIFKTDLPTYVYYELFSSTLTIFTLTEFGLNIRILFNSVHEGRTQSNAEEGRSGSGTSSSGKGSKHEMSSISNGTRPRPMTNNSTSPLASNAADTAGYNGGDFDPTTSSQHRDYIPYPTTSPKPVSISRHTDWDQYPYGAANDALMTPNQTYQPSTKESYNEISESRLQSQRSSDMTIVHSPTLPDRALSPPPRSRARVIDDDKVRYGRKA